MTDFIDDFFVYLQCLWDSFVLFMQDLGVSFVRSMLEAFASIISAIPFPNDFAAGLSDAYSSLDPSLLYFLDATNVPQCLGIIGSGIVFRLTRKIVTLGQW